MSGDLCTGFEPQTYLRERCKKCFRPKSKHEEPLAAASSTTSPSTTKRDNGAASPSSTKSGSPSPPSQSSSRRERRKSWRDGPRAHANDDGGAPDQDVSEETDLMSVSSYKSANSKGGLSSAKSLESVTSNGDTRSMVTAVSGSMDDEEENRAITPTTEHEYPSPVSVKEELARAREEITKLKEERERWTLRRAKSGRSAGEQTLVEMLEERLAEAENCIQDYRDENTVLKCELREIQEAGPVQANEGDTKLSDKLKTTESLCEELMEENETLKADVKDLQQEIEEMQDQYREEEIDEFRELQRELEQNAKNCRVLQFKLRKSERQREQTDAEKNHLECKIKDILTNNGVNGSATLSESSRIKELESELRIAKEVSVRLHNELEQTEEKRYRLEDDVFYLKEKIREMQTQTKWREARNKTDNAVKRLSAELLAAAPTVNSDMSKEMRDALEREIDIREQLKFAEEDLKRTQMRLQDLENENEGLLKKIAKLSAKSRPPMTRSASEGHAQIQLELAEHEVENLTNKVQRLEQTNDHLTKKIIEMQHNTTKRAVENGTGTNDVVHLNITPEMERDMSKMISTISELERKNLELSLQIKKEAEAKTNGTKPGPSPAAELRQEQEKRRVLEAEIAELKQTLMKTDNQKLIAMATKVEMLTQQLSLVNERCNTLHKKCAKETDKYSEELKSRIESLEKQLSEAKAAEVITDLQGKVPTVDEIEQCCEVLASVEAQTTRICKQIEKLELAQKDERRRSLSKDSGATIIAELANLMGELRSVHQLLDNHKLNNPAYIRKSPVREQAAAFTPAECSKCKSLEQEVEEQKNEIVFYKKKNKDLTNQVLQTEDRWTIEIEKQRQIFQNEIKNLTVRLADAKRTSEEHAQLLEAKTSTLQEKTKMLEENEEKCKKLANEIKEKQKELQSAKEFEIKYKKLESIFEQEREKMNAERQRSKNEVMALKKIGDDAEELLKRTSDESKKRESLLLSEKKSLETEIQSLKKQLAAGDVEDPITSVTRSPEKRHPAVQETAESGLTRKDSDKIQVIDLRKQIAHLEKKLADTEAKLQEVKIENVDLKSELKKTQDQWTKDKEAHAHKLRQTDKLRTVEMDALQQKFSSRMRIMEDTNKSLHTQLVHARRERDSHKDGLGNLEKRIEEDRKVVEEKEKAFIDLNNRLKTAHKKLEDTVAELERANTDLRLTKEARKADQILFNIERSRGKNDKLTEAQKKETEKVQQQYQECEKFYMKEVERLNERIRELSADGVQKQRDFHRLREQIHLLEIEKRNEAQARDALICARELLEAEQSRLQQAVHLSELQKLTRKYRLSDDRCSSAQPSVSGTDRFTNLGGNGSESDYQYDNISQSSFSIRSVQSIPIRANVRWTTTTSTNAPSTNLIGPSRAFSVDAGQNSLESRLAEIHARSQSPAKKLANYPDPPPNFILNMLDADKDKKVEYDKEGRLHYVPRSGGLARSTSYDRQGASLALPPTPGSAEPASASVSETNLHPRNSSTGSRILSQVRREELARGGQPSVRLMAKAFDSIDSAKEEKRGLFSIRKSRSVETAEAGRKGSGGVSESNPGNGKVPLHALKHNQSLSQIEDSLASTTAGTSISTEPPVFGTVPRGGRNPFKNMGSKFVERVRRSLSRTSTNSRRDSDDATANLIDDGTNIPVTVLKPPKQVSWEILRQLVQPDSKPTVKKTKKKISESKGRKTIAVMNKLE